MCFFLNCFLSVDLFMVDLFTKFAESNFKKLLELMMLLTFLEKVIWEKIIKIIKSLKLHQKNTRKKRKVRLIYSRFIFTLSEKNINLSSFLAVTNNR